MAEYAASPVSDGRTSPRIQPNLNEWLLSLFLIARLPRALRTLVLAVMETPSEPAPWRAKVIAPLRAALGGTSETSVTNRLAGTIFIIRVLSAALAYLAQILLARWMGGSDYGVYVYVWIWVLLLGSLLDFGIAVSAQKIIPDIARVTRRRCCAVSSPADAG